MIDSKVLIDLLENDPNWADWSETQLTPLAEAGLAVINPIIYAEVAANFATIEVLNAAVQSFYLQGTSKNSPNYDHVESTHK